MACVVNGCTSHSTKKKYRSGNQRFTFHRFPRDEYFKQLWIKAIGRYDWQPTEHSRICCKHFSEDCYVQDTKRKWLCRSAIPTIFDNNLSPNSKQKDSSRKARSSETEANKNDELDGNYVENETNNEPLAGSLQSNQLEPNLSDPDGASLNFTENFDIQIKVEQKMSDDEGSSQFECRTCLRIITKEAGFHNIFQPWHSPWNPRKKSTIAEDLTKLVNVVLQESDKHSKVICQGCCVKLYNACQFIVNTKKCDEILKKRNVQDITETPVPIEGKLWPKPIQVDKNLNSDIFSDVEIKQEMLSDEFDEDDFDDVETQISPDMDIKIEPEEMAALPLKVTVNGTIAVNQMGKHRTIVSNGCDTFEKVEYLDSTIKDEPQSEDESLDLPLECMLCSKHFNSMSGLKAHVIAHHSYKSVRRKDANSSPEPAAQRFVCGTCKRAFVTRTDLMVHETCHNKWVCYGCSRNFDSFGRLSKHRKFCKAAQKEAAKPKLLEDVIRPLPEITMEQILANKMEDEPLQETLQCDMCSEKFSDTYYMKIHHEIHHAMEAKNDDAQSNVAELSKESKDMETKALQNMFEQVNETINDKSDSKVEIDIKLNEDGNVQKIKAGAENRETDSDMQMETDVLPVVLDCKGDASEAKEKEIQNGTENKENQIIETEKNHIAETENTQLEVGDKSHNQTDKVQASSFTQEVNENQSKADKNDSSDNQVKVNVEIVSDHEKTVDDTENNDQADDSMVLEETVSRSEERTVEETVDGENTFEEAAVNEEVSENTTDENRKAFEVSVNDESVVKDSLQDEHNNKLLQENVKSEKGVQEVGKIVSADNKEVGESLPTLEVAGQDDMEIDSEI